jgi:hypothetical protein
MMSAPFAVAVRCRLMERHSVLSTDMQYLASTQHRRTWRPKAFVCSVWLQEPRHITGCPRHYVTCSCLCSCPVFGNKVP